MYLYAPSGLRFLDVKKPAVVSFGGLSGQDEALNRFSMRRKLLTMRDFMDTLRASGIQTGGPDSLSQRDRQAFAAELEKWWLEVQRSRG